MSLVKGGVHALLASDLADIASIKVILPTIALDNLSGLGNFETLYEGLNCFSFACHTR